MVLKSLAENVGETCNLAVADRFNIVCLDRVKIHWPLGIQLPIGTKVPLHCTASGRMYLSSLRIDKLGRRLMALDFAPQTKRSMTEPDVLQKELTLSRERGYTADNQEFLDGMAAIAVGDYDDQERLLTTLSIHAPMQRQDIDDLVKNFDLLQEAARRLEILAQSWRAMISRRASSRPKPRDPFPTSLSPLAPSHPPA